MNLAIIRLVPFTMLLASVALLMLGVGLQNTLLGVRAGLESFSNIEVGSLMGAYFVGFLAGSTLVPSFISNVGHIRTFSVLASLASCAVLLHLAAINPYAWGVLRLVTGFSIAGLYLVVESWLNGRAEANFRGLLLSAYFFVNLGAVAFGQLLLQADDPGGFQLFIYSSVLMSLAVIPVGLTRSEAPAPTRRVSFDFSAIIRISPYALMGTAMAGLANGAFWGLAPLYGVQTGFSSNDIAVAMTVTILGGAALQLPLGRLSDIVDRRIVISASNVVLGLIAAIIALQLFGTGAWGALVAFLFGGLLLTQYGLCIAHANDFVGDGDFVQLAGALLLVFGACAAVGPVAGSILMTAFGPNALFWFVAAAAFASTAFALWRMSQRQVVETRDFAPAAAGLSGAILAPSEAALEGVGETGPFEIRQQETEKENVGS
ncbi:MAG: MFS transporter [Rhodobiaceae bacterium]|nr:MFS transporter [Rhodobiaceae bacterium]MCC0056604.1 MFS transporter [Rhodobiaceae bacterium]